MVGSKYEANQLINEVWRIEFVASLCLDLSRKYLCMWRGYNWSCCNWLYMDHWPHSTFQRARFYCHPYLCHNVKSHQLQTLWHSMTSYYCARLVCCLWWLGNLTKEELYYIRKYEMQVFAKWLSRTSFDSRLTFKLWPYFEHASQKMLWG